MKNSKNIRENIIVIAHIKEISFRNKKKTPRLLNDGYGKLVLYI